MDSVFGLWKDPVGESHKVDGLGVDLSFSPVSQFSTALPGIAFGSILFSSHDLVSSCSHYY